MKFVALGEVVEIKGGGTPSKEVAGYWNGDIPWASVKDFKGMTLSSTVDRISASGVRNSATQIIPAGNIIVPTRMAVGKAAVNTIDMAINQDLKAIIPGPKVQVRYLLHALLANAKLLEDQATGATVKGIKLDALRTLQIPLPPVEEQKRIAAILDQADALRRLRARALDRLNALGQAIFHEMFGDPVTNPKNLPAATLGDVCKFISGGTPSKDREDFWDGSIPWVSPKDMKSNEIWASQDHVSALALENSPLKLIRENTPLIVVRGMILAHTVPIAISRVPCTINQDMKALTFDGTINSDFAVACLRAQHASILGKVATAAHGTKRLDTSELTALPMLCPSREAQQSFVDAIDQLTTLAEESRSSLQLENNLFTSLQHRAFRGEL